MGIEVKPSHGYPKANRNAGSRLAQPRLVRTKASWHSKSVSALCIQFHRQVEFQSRPAVGISRRPRFSMIERTIARPIPIPFDLVVKKASKSPWHDLGIDAFPGAEPRFGCAPFRADLHVSPPHATRQRCRRQNRTHSRRRELYDRTKDEITLSEVARIRL
jgi:hypothetical protein